MANIQAVRLLNALESGQITNAALESALAANKKRLGDFELLLNERGQQIRLVNNIGLLGSVADSEQGSAAISRSPELILALGKDSVASASLANKNAIAKIASNVHALKAALSSPYMGATIINSAYAMGWVVSAGNTYVIMESGDGIDAIVNSPVAVSAIAANLNASKEFFAYPGAVNALVANQAAMNTFAANANGMSALTTGTDSLSRMQTVWASDMASDAILSSSVGRNAVYNADNALTALQYNSNQVQRQITSRTTLSSISTQSGIFVANGTKAILLRRYYSSASEYECLAYARGSTSSTSGVTSGDGSRHLNTVAIARGCSTNTYVNNGSAPVSDIATSNFVGAANGLLRTNWAVTNSTVYVRYILV